MKTFLSSTGSFRVEELDADASHICVLDASLRITYVNRAWREFGRANGAEWDEARWMGATVLGATPPVLRPFVSNLFARARDTNVPVEHSYECSSTSTEQHFRMIIFPSEGGGFVVAHSLSRAQSLTRDASPAFESLYVSAHGFITQCSHCRRVRHGGVTAELWDFVAEYAAKSPPNTSHGLCPLCAPFYYGL